MDSENPLSAKLPRRRRLFTWGLGIVAVVVLTIFGLIERVSHRPSPFHATLSAAEIGAEDLLLKQAGLTTRDGSLLKGHPFEPPWTSHSLLVPSTWTYRPLLTDKAFGPRRVRADLLRADLDVLEPVMERAYGGWDSAAARGWNWEQWFAQWRGVLARKGSREISLDEAFAPVDSLLEFQRDNHTNIPLNRHSTLNGDHSQTALLTGTPTEPCDEIRAGDRLHPVAARDESQNVRRAKLWRTVEKVFTNASYIAMPSSYGTPQAVHCGNWIPLQPIENRTPSILTFLRGALSPDRPRIKRLGGGIVYARLPTFTWSNYEKISRSDWDQRQPRDRVLIVDLRDNDGGSFGYGLAAIGGWIDEKRIVPWEMFGRQVASSCLYAPLRWNEEIALTSRLLPSHREFLQGLLDRMAEPYPPDCPHTVDSHPAQWTYLQRRFEPAAGAMRIIALVNSGCGSDCELFTAELASLPETIVVGTNTFGVGQFIQPGYSILPNSKLRYRIALGRSNFYGDDRSFDGYGLDVDVVLPDVDKLQPEQLRDLAEAVADL